MISVTTVGQRLGTCYTNMVPGRTTLNSMPSLCRNPECTAKSRLQFAKQHTVVPFSRCSSPSLRSAETPAGIKYPGKLLSGREIHGHYWSVEDDMHSHVSCWWNVDQIRANIVIHNIKMTSPSAYYNYVDVSQYVNCISI